MFWTRLRDSLLPVLVPVAALVIWHVSIYGRQFNLIPPPSDVALALYDLAFGGVYEDTFSQTLR
ncbi:MAG: hypothetical protein IRY89_16560 [Pseudolabrys sp.]|nr:hypothetical protein [Pseudolabrys sp.]